MSEHPDRPGVPRVVVDPNVYVSAAISPAGSTVNDLVDLLVQGRAIPCRCWHVCACTRWSDDLPPLRRAWAMAW